ncbi:MAG: hypothetical protein ACP5DX_00385 [Paracoccaceae bacterium]
MSRPFLISVLLLLATAPPSRAGEAPAWVIDRYCATWANRVACAEQVRETYPHGGGEGEFPIEAWCSYQGPGGQGDYADLCFYTWRANPYELVERYGVRNGASVGLLFVEADSASGRAGDVFFNGVPARKVTGGEGLCVETLATRERFCRFADRPE